MLNQWLIIGRLGKDAETRFTSTGKSVTTFSVAVSEKRKNADGDYVEDTTWVDVRRWDAGGVTEYLLKGKLVLVEGKYKSESYEDREGNRRYRNYLLASRIQLLPTAKAEGGEQGEMFDAPAAPAKKQGLVSQPRSAAAKAPAAPPPSYGAMEITDDDLPF